MADLEAIRRGAAPSESLALAPTAASSNRSVPELRSTLPVLSSGSEAVSSSAHPESSNIAAIQDEGDVAAKVFADLTSGRALTQIVIDRRLAPDIVRQAHAAWLSLSDFDALRKPAAETQLAQVEADIRVLGERLAILDQAVHEVSSAALRGRQEVDARLRAIGTRSNGASVPGVVYQRLEALEARLRSLPAAPLLLPERRCGCGAPLAVLACCPACGAGCAAS